MTETEFAMVSEWMSNGNINQFLRERRDANRLELVSSLSDPPYHLLTVIRLTQLSDVAKGLIYVHDQGMIHGDLKGVCPTVPQPNTFPSTALIC
jgi:serine/threonine protein kinase